MSVVPYALKLGPRYLEKPWGGRRIGDLFGRDLPGTEPIGESWEFCDRPDGASEILNGPLAGKTLADLRQHVALPLLTKIIDARETLSVQVHPDREAAEELGGEAKTEAWFILAAEPGSRIYKGLRPGVRAPELLKAIREDRVPDCLHSFEPKAGDVIFLPPGTIHAIGGGITLFEAQQNSDTTYRIYDWGRKGLDGEPRELHVNQAIRSTDFSGPGRERSEPRTISDDGRYRQTLLVECTHFAMEEHELLGLTTFETERQEFEQYHVLLFLAGEGIVRPFRRGAEETFFSPGDTLLLPAEHEFYEVEPRPGQTAKFLTVYEQ